MLIVDYLLQPSCYLFCRDSLMLRRVRLLSSSTKLRIDAPIGN